MVLATRAASQNITNNGNNDVKSFFSLACILCFGDILLHLLMRSVAWHKRRDDRLCTALGAGRCQDRGCKGKDKLNNVQLE